MNRLLGALLGMVCCGTSVGLLYAFLDYRSLTASDGLDAGFAWMFLIILSGMGVVAGGVGGYRLGPRLKLADRWERLKTQLQPPDERGGQP